MDAYSRQDAILMLSSVNLPGGVQVGNLFKKNQTYTDPRLLICSNDASKASKIRK